MIPYWIKGCNYLLKNDPYFKKYYKAWKDMNEDVEVGGIDPIKVSKLILKIINKKNPKIHYVVGKPLQKFSIILKKKAQIAQ